MPKKIDRPHTIGNRWLAPPDDKYKTYGISWYEPGRPARPATAGRAAQPARSRQTPRVTTGETDFAKAYLVFVKYCHEHPESGPRSADVDRVPSLIASAQAITTENLRALESEAELTKAEQPAAKIIAAKDLALAVVMLHYYAIRCKDRTRRGDRTQKAQVRAAFATADPQAFIAALTPDGSIKNPERVKDSMRNAMEVWGDVMCSELDPTRQNEFVRVLRARRAADGSRQLTDATILTRLKCIWTCMNFAVNAGLLMKEAVPERVHADRWLPRAHLPPRRVKLGLAELAAMADVAATRERWWRWFLQALGLGWRPSRLLQITPAEVDLEIGNVTGIIEGDEENHGKKGLATVRCPPTLLRWYAQWNKEVLARPERSTKTYVELRGRQLTGLDFFMEIARRAGVKIPKKAGAYVIRHSVAKYLARKGCPREQRRVWLGQAVDTGSAGGYVDGVELEPEYLKDAARIAEQLYHEIAALMTGPRSILEPSAPTDPEAFGWKKRLPPSMRTDVKRAGGIEMDQPEPMRYQNWFFEKLSEHAWRLTTTSCVAMRGTKMRNPPINQGISVTPLLSDNEGSSE